MANRPGTCPAGPADLLTDLRRLAHQVRLAQRGAWFPLLLLAAVTMGAIPADRCGHHSDTCTPHAAGLIGIDKVHEGRRGRTWIRPTKTGRNALAEEIAALRKLVRLFDSDQP